MEEVKRNPFEALCEARYCWRLGCTTCGNWPLRYDLYRLVLGHHPDDPDWKGEFRFVEAKTGKGPYREIVVHPEREKFPSRYPEYPPPRELSETDQLKLKRGQLPFLAA